jgi:hypothetical protein
MFRSIALRRAAIAIGLATLMVPAASSTAHAGISVPLPPPSLTPPTKPKAQAQPAINVVVATER